MLPVSPYFRLSTGSFQLDEQAKYPKRVVTLLIDSTPIAVVELGQSGGNYEDCDIYYNGLDSLQATHENLVAAASAVSYLIWKETGILPAPRGYEPPEATEKLPF